MLKAYVCRLCVTLCIVAKRCALEQKLLLTVTIDVEYLVEYLGSKGQPTGNGIWAFKWSRDQ